MVHDRARARHEGGLATLCIGGIPAYVIWMADGSYDLLPITVIAEMVSHHLEDAAKKFPAEKYAVN